MRVLSCAGSVVGVLVHGAPGHQAAVHVEPVLAPCEQESEAAGVNNDTHDGQLRHDRAAMDDVLRGYGAPELDEIRGALVAGYSRPMTTPRSQHKLGRRRWMETIQELIRRMY